MITEKAGFIGTSNWTEDYFSDSAGVSFTFEIVEGSDNNPNSILNQLEEIFQRDWNSKIALSLSKDYGENHLKD